MIDPLQSTVILDNLVLGAVTAVSINMDPEYARIKVIVKIIEKRFVYTLQDIRKNPNNPNGIVICLMRNDDRDSKDTGEEIAAGTYEAIRALRGDDGAREFQAHLDKINS